MPPHSNHAWPSSLGPNARPNPQRRESWAPGPPTSLWPPVSASNGQKFDPFAPDALGASAWPMPAGFGAQTRQSANLLPPPMQRKDRFLNVDQEGASPEHISMMLRNLGITPSPGATPMPAPISTERISVRDPISPSTGSPPALSPTTQIMSMGSNSSIHTPTPTRAMEPLFTPTSMDHSSFGMAPVGSQALFSTSAAAETPTKARLRLSSTSDEIAAHSRRSTGGASNMSHQYMNLGPRHTGMGLQIPVSAAPTVPSSPATSHERVMSWMQRQALSPSHSSSSLNNMVFNSAAGSPRQDWVLGSPQMAMANLNGLPAWDRPVAQPQGSSASIWAPRPTSGFTGRDVSNVPRSASRSHVGEEPTFSFVQERKMSDPGMQEPINFLRLLQPSSQPPYALFVARIVKNSDQQASIFLQQKLKAATTEDARRPLVDAIIGQGFDMMTNRFGNWAVQRCLEAPCTPKERKRVAEVMKGRVIELATNCYGTHVVQKALDCAEEIQLSVVSEMLQGDLAATLMNKHASHVWTKIMELTWTEPAPPIFDYVNKAMQGRWADLARHETGSLIVQHAFENLEDSDKSDCVQEVLMSIDTLATDQWGSWVVQHLLENGTENDRTQAVNALVDNIPSLSTDAQGVKAIEKAIKSGGPQAVEQVVRRLSAPAKSGRRPLVVDLALGSAGSQLVSMLLPLINKAQWVMLHESVRGHIVTLKGSKSGSRVVWLFERMKAQHNN